MRSSNILRTSLAIAMCCSISNCATLQDTSLGRAAKNTFNNDDPCSHNARNTGMAIGALAGAIIGSKLGDKKAGATIAGTALGLTIGGLIGKDMDNKRCELSKIARQYDLNLEIANVDMSGAVIEPSRQEKSPQLMGLAVTLGEKNGQGHFESGSDVLTPKAKEYFAKIADTYNPTIAAEKILNNEQRSEFLIAAKQKKILLVGHTDDTGDTQLNADLSERRARAVAKYLKEHGIAESSLYFQGAGESLPKADNRTAEGRAQNRRVELVEISDEGNFKKYLETRQPKLEFYRTAISTKTSLIPTERSTTQNRISTTPSTSINKPAEKNIAPPKTLTSGKEYNFGGKPIDSINASIDAGRIVQEDAGFSFSLLPKAYADSSGILGNCSDDRPRASGNLKALSNGKQYETTEYLTGLYDTSWHDTLNGNLVMLNKVGILRDSTAPANLPELKIYASYDPQKSKTAKPNIQTSPAVNTYRGTKGVLYRVFAAGSGGIQCMDVLFPIQGGLEAKSGKLLYTNNGEIFAADYKPKMIR